MPAVSDEEFLVLIKEVGQAVADFVELYNDQWLIEKNGYPSPRQAREAYYSSEVEDAA